MYNFITITKSPGIVPDKVASGNSAFPWIYPGCKKVQKAELKQCRTRYYYCLARFYSCAVYIGLQQLCKDCWSLQIPFTKIFSKMFSLLGFFLRFPFSVFLQITNLPIPRKHVKPPSLKNLANHLRPLITKISLTSGTHAVLRIVTPVQLPPIFLHKGLPWVCQNYIRSHHPNGLPHHITVQNQTQPHQNYLGPLTYFETKGCRRSCTSSVFFDSNL